MIRTAEQLEMKLLAVPADDTASAWWINVGVVAWDEQIEPSALLARWQEIDDTLLTAIGGRWFVRCTGARAQRYLKAARRMQQVTGRASARG